MNVSGHDVSLLFPSHAWDCKIPQYCPLALQTHRMSDNGYWLCKWYLVMRKVKINLRVLIQNKHTLAAYNSVIPTNDKACIFSLAP